MTTLGGDAGYSYPYNLFSDQPGPSALDKRRVLEAYRFKRDSSAKLRNKRKNQPSSSKFKKGFPMYSTDKQSKVKNNADKSRKELIRKIYKANSSTKDCSHKTSEKITNSMLRETLLQRSLSPEKNSHFFRLGKHQKQELARKFIEYSNDRINQNRDFEGSDELGKGHQSMCKTQTAFDLMDPSHKIKKGNFYFSKKKNKQVQKCSNKSSKELTDFLLHKKLRLIKSNQDMLEPVGVDLFKKKVLYEKMSKVELIKMLLKKEAKLQHPTFLESQRGALQESTQKKKLAKMRNSSFKYPEKINKYVKHEAGNLSESRGLSQKKKTWISRKQKNDATAKMEDLKERLVEFLKINATMAIDYCKLVSQYN